jgi:hypothetical protein
MKIAEFFLHQRITRVLTGYFLIIQVSSFVYDRGKLLQASLQKTKMRSLILLFLIVVLLLAACAPQIPVGQESSNGLDVTPSAQPPGTPTAVIVWFPATATWTPFPSVEPSVTPILFPGLGTQVFSDDFSQLQNWSRAKAASEGGNSIILDRNRLTLAANVMPVSLASLHSSLVLSNFYAEVTVSVNRCSGSDEYGLLFRAASEAYTYRFLLNCKGMARVERVRDSTTLPLQDWLASGDAPPGAPGQVRMGVWAAGTEMRFFLNGRYQFSVIDPLFKSGSLGVFANASSPDGLNISFSDLTVNSVEYVSPTPTVTPSRSPVPTRTPRPTP